MKYSIDTCAILHGWMQYPQDIFPTIWSSLADLAVSGEIMASDEVLEELSGKHDDAYDWALGHREMFYPVDEPIQYAVREILAEHRNLYNPRKDRSGADPFVIALASIDDRIVVTEEKPSNNPDRPKIPNVCDAMGIRCITFLDLIRDQGWVFR